MPYDFAVIGAGGVIGAAIARELALKMRASVIALEKEQEFAAHASGRNSGVIHSGINQKPGTKKAEFCVRGSDMLRKYCVERGVPMKQCGTLVVSRTDAEEERLELLYKNGIAAGVPDLSYISVEKFAEREPATARKDITKVLFSPTGAIVNSRAIVDELLTDLILHYVQYMPDKKVLDITNDNQILTPKGKFTAKHIINCAGLYADKIAHMMGVGKQYEIIPFRGEYMQVRLPEQFNSMVYHPPANSRYPFLGIHLTRTVEETVIAGPTAVPSFGRESYDKRINFGESFETYGSKAWWKLVAQKDFRDLAYGNFATSLFKGPFVKEIRSLLREDIAEHLTPDDVQPYRAGIRAQLVNTKAKDTPEDPIMINDFLIIQNERGTHVLNAVSPGLTSSLAFAEHVANQIQRTVRVT